MYAIFEDGSRQYRVSEGEHVIVDYRPLEKGQEIVFDRVLLVQTNAGLHIGQPYVVGAQIVGKVVEHPSLKYYIQKFRRRKNYRRRKGHRQRYCEVQINQIVMPGA
ncbi:MAG: 50S ribosomal protein L21 [Gemmatales bacterium]|nr:50S ribosomal protein L21 [Gemmatales bacterium]MCS7159948.1 50S ribosomal protein L21 [Gemmatales bacterium]MDW8175147.1 50S ribosomal protein L21 [Gemmatales bacterium]MDW8221942.1 50S ribosomal protein L21 [Gemmatales bacterium]